MNTKDIHSKPTSPRTLRADGIAPIDPATLSKHGKVELSIAQAKAKNGSYKAQARGASRRRSRKPAESVASSIDWRKAGGSAEGVAREGYERLYWQGDLTASGEPSRKLKPCAYCGLNVTSFRSHNPHCAAYQAGEIAQFPDYSKAPKMAPLDRNVIGSANKWEPLRAKEWNNLEGGTRERTQENAQVTARVQHGALTHDALNMLENFKSADTRLARKSAPKPKVTVSDKPGPLARYKVGTGLGTLYKGIVRSKG